MNIEHAQFHSGTNQYIEQCVTLGLSPIQALSALEQLEAVCSPAERSKVVEAINHFTALQLEHSLV